MESLQQSAAASPVRTKFIHTEIREGDWDAYLLHGGNPRRTTLDDDLDDDDTIAYRQKCALDYLGRRAQFHGGVCSKTKPRIFTAEFIAELHAENRKQRFNRYPWLEKLLDLVAEIEREQENIAGSSNVISLISATK